MKKQFFRVKQLADQTFLRADKSEVFNHEELQIADHRVEYIRGALAAISKRIPSPASLQNNEGNIEKRMKKYPEFQLGQVFQEQGHRTKDSIEEDCQLLQYILRECGQAEVDLAKEQAEHEIKVEQLVSAPLQAVIDNDLPNIFKHKQNLKKYILDKDSASNRYHAASKNGPQRESLKDDMEEADSKVEQHRDVLAAEMFNLLRKESELSQYILQLLKLQRAYHESALKNLEKVIPKLEQNIGDSHVKAVFGLNLEEHLRVTGRKIAYPLELCICALSEIGMLEEGLFRVVGGASRVKRLKLSIDSGCFSPPLLQEYQDVHVLASTLKLYLRELPEPLLTYNLYDDWMAAMRYPDDQRILVIQDILKKLPAANRINLTYLVQFLSKLSKNQENKMSCSNLAIVMAPNLLWHSNKDMDMHMGNCATLNMIMELFINKADLLFPEDVTQYLSLSRNDLFTDELEFQRPVLNNVRLINHENAEQNAHHHPNNPSHQLDSPKPQTRMRKTKLAPTPPSLPPGSNKSDTESVTGIPPSYPSGSTTLTRSHKVRSTILDGNSGGGGGNSLKSKAQNDEKSLLPRRQSLVIESDSSSSGSLFGEKPKISSVGDDAKTKVVPQITAQTMNVDKITITTNSLQQKASDAKGLQGKPVAAPRTFNFDEGSKMPHAFNCRDYRTGSSDNLMTKSLNAIDIESDSIQVRNKPREDAERPSKPTVPVRPASLKAIPRSSVDNTTTTSTTTTITNNNINPSDPAVQRTQCSVYNVAHKQQPSYVNIQLGRSNGEKHHLPGHDNLIAEKERFLGHQPSTTNEKTLSFYQQRPLPSAVEEDVAVVVVGTVKGESMRTRTSSLGSGNRPEVPPKATGIIKSSEKLNLPLDGVEKVNGFGRVGGGGSGHTRTQSDGNIVDATSTASSHAVIGHTPPSPRSLNKPTEPPPPPPVNRAKPEAAVTSLPTTGAPADSTKL